MKKKGKGKKTRRLVVIPGEMAPMWITINEDDDRDPEEARLSDALSQVLDGTLRSSYIARHRFELMKYAVKTDAADALPLLMPESRRLSPERFEELVSLAAASGSPESQARLLQYRRERYTDADFEAIEQKRFDTELGLAAPGLSDYRKIFKISFVPGGIHVGGPKGKAAGHLAQTRVHYHIPAAINGTPIVSVDRAAFYAAAPYAVISRDFIDDAAPATISLQADPASGITSDQATLTAPGNTIYFGRFSDNKSNKSNKKAECPIPWIVLQRQDDTLLVISALSIADLPFNPVSGDTNWETCGLRRWLNNVFLPLSFTQAERRLIVCSDVPAADSHRFGTVAGGDTKDFLYIPSLEEAKDLFSSDEERRTGSWWWLRTPGCEQDFSATVSPDGRPIAIGNFVDSEYGVRPLMRIKV